MGDRHQQRKVVTAANKSARDQVVEALFALREWDHPETSEQYQRRQDFAPVATCGSSEGNAAAIEVGNHQPHEHLADGGLPRGALESGVIEPHKHDQDPGEHQQGSDVALVSELLSARNQTEDYEKLDKNEKDHYADAEQDRVDDKGGKPASEAGVCVARGRCWHG